jgi:hypothetical protein
VRVQVWSIPAGSPEEAAECAKPKRQAARERKIAGRPFDDRQLLGLDLLEALRVIAETPDPARDAHINVQIAKAALAEHDRRKR